jgi:hypothetical protein
MNAKIPFMLIVGEEEKMAQYVNMGKEKATLPLRLKIAAIVEEEIKKH